MTRPVRRHSVAVAGALLGALLAVAAPAVAAWTDTAPVAGTTLTAATVPAPVLGCGPLGLGSVTFSWPAVSGASGYRVTFTDSSGTTSVSTDVTSTSVVATTSSAITSGTAVVQTRMTYPGGGSWLSAASGARAYTVLLTAVSVCG